MDSETPAPAPRPITEVAADLGLGPDDLIPCGRGVVKVDRAALLRGADGETGRLVLVSAITPTAAGEGKTTTTIGLTQGLWRRGQRACAVLREPSLGPYLGKKGGATGGGLSQLVPARRINLHFTGDLHAVTAAHNLLAALVDNHMHHGNALGIDPRRVIWPRVLDLNDRALRQVVVGLGGPENGYARETGFECTAASEVMATLCLARDVTDLRQRLGRLLVAFDREGQPVTADDLEAAGALCELLDDAFHPNLVQTNEGTPVLVHGGPFANIAHGCNSLLATRLALQQADWAVTEAGFGFDLGAEKFLDIKCRVGDLSPAAIVLVATVRALKWHGGVKRRAFETPDPQAVARGLENLDAHLAAAGCYGIPVVVGLNAFATDTKEEQQVVRDHCRTQGVAFAVSEHFAAGGAGAEALAEAVITAAATPSAFAPLYPLELPVEEKLRRIATRIYGAGDVHLSRRARQDLAEIERLGLAGLPICVAKTHDSLSDHAGVRGRPTGFELNVQQILPNPGAGFLVVLTGTILRMPGLPRRPRALGL